MSTPVPRTRHPGSRAARFTQRDVVRALKAAIAATAGMKVAAVEAIVAGVTVRVVLTEAAVVAPSPAPEGGIPERWRVE